MVNPPSVSRITQSEINRMFTDIQSARARANHAEQEGERLRGQSRADAQAARSRIDHLEQEVARLRTENGNLEAEKASRKDSHRRSRARMLMHIEDYAQLHEQAADAAAAFRHSTADTRNSLQEAHKKNVALNEDKAVSCESLLEFGQC